MARYFRNLSLCLISIITGSLLQAQCMTYPVAFNTRVNAASEMVIGKMTSATCYQDAQGNIWTANIIQVDAWLKNAKSDTEVAVITPGGTVEGAAALVFPSLAMLPGKRYALMLDQSAPVVQSPELALAKPGMIQTLSVADAQGALTEEHGLYYDLHAESPQTEFELLTQVAALTGQEPVTPEGRPYRPRPYTGGTLAVPRAITSFTPNPAYAGTVNTLDWLLISGSGFGASDTVWFPNANDGGATLIYEPVPTDINSWTTTDISVKVPTQTGSGTFEVANLFASSSPLTIRFAHLSINSAFLNFASSTRQRYYLRDLNGGGGYTLKMNSAFFASAAKAPFERAVETWRCATFVNFWVDTSAVATSAIASDGECTVLFDPGLPLGVLGRATSRFNGGGALAFCEQENTVWWLTEVDYQFADPPFTGFTWNYGPGLTGGTEFDFESVALHETGHAHGLGHVIDAGAVMHYAIVNGTTSRTLSADDIAGGDEKMGYSTAATCFDPAPSGSPMALLTVSSCILTQALPTLSGRYLTGKGQQLTWEVASSADYVRFELERSLDSYSFEGVTDVWADGSKAYTYLDKAIPARQQVFYRVKGIAPDGTARISPVVEITLPEVPLTVTYSQENTNLEIAGMQTQGVLKVFQLDGKLVQVWQLTTGTQSLSLNGLSAGVYAYVLQSGVQQAQGRMMVRP